MSNRGWFLLSVVAGLVGIGLVVLYSATAVRCAEARIGDPLFFFRKQLLWTLIAVAGLVVASRVPTTVWIRLRWPLLFLTIGLLAVVLVPGVGRGKEGRHGAQRWLEIAGYSLQPSELAKLTLAIFLCSFATENPERLRRFFRGFLPAFGILAVACGLIAKEPDAGTAALTAAAFGLVLFVAGARLVHLLPCLAIGGTGAAWYLYTHMGHVRDRIATWLNPGADPLNKGLQLKQSLIALGSGGLWGEGLGRGTLKLYYLPEVHADFLLPVLGEELGFVGTGAVLCLYVLLGVAGWRIARRAATPFGFLFSVAITGLIMLQAAMNVAVVTGTMPTKGIPLPLMSFGGSSLLFTMVGIGILVRIAKEGEGARCTESSACSSPAEAPADICIPASR